MAINPQNIHKDNYGRIFEFFRKVDYKRTSGFDGRVVAMAFRLVFYTGIKSSLLEKITIGKSVHNNYQAFLGNPISGMKINTEFKFTEKKVNRIKYRYQIPDRARRRIKKYFYYLKRDKRYEFNSGSPLFPKTDGKENNINNLRQHMKQFSEQSDKQGKPYGFNFEYLRRAGIRFYYAGLIKKGYSAEKAFDETVEFACSSKQHVENILLNR